MKKETLVPSLSFTKLAPVEFSLSDSLPFSLDDLSFSTTNMFSPPITKSDQLSLLDEEEDLLFKPVSTHPCTSIIHPNHLQPQQQQQQSKFFEDPEMMEFGFDDSQGIFPDKPEQHQTLRFLSPALVGGVSDEEPEEQAEGAQEEVEEGQRGEEVEEEEAEESHPAEEEDEEEEDEENSESEDDGALASDDSDFEEHERSRKRPKRTSRALASPIKGTRGGSGKSAGKKGKNASGARGSKRKDSTSENESPVVKERKKPGRKPKILDEETRKIRSQLRQEKNRVAARRCREKKQEYFLQLEEEVNKLRGEKDDMGQEINHLREMVQKFKKRLGEA